MVFTLFSPNSGGNSLQYHELKFWQRPILCQGLGKTLHMCHSELVLSKGFGEVLFGMVCSCGGAGGSLRYVGEAPSIIGHISSDQGLLAKFTVKLYIRL